MLSSKLLYTLQKLFVRERFIIEYVVPYVSGDYSRKDKRLLFEEITQNITS